MKRLSQEEEQKRFMLYEQGLSDKEIAEKCGVSTTAIRNWRINRKLGYGNKKLSSISMEQALTPEQCKFVRQFFKILIYSKKLNPQLDVGCFMREYRDFINGYKNKREARI